MSNKITGKGGPSVTGTSESNAAQGADFQAKIDEARTKRANGLAEMQAQIQAGQLSVPQAIDQLVQRSLNSPMAAQLSPEKRAELETLLRGQLANDPTLLALQAQLDPNR